MRSIHIQASVFPYMSRRISCVHVPDKRIRSRRIQTGIKCYSLFFSQKLSGFTNQFQIMIAFYSLLDRNKCTFSYRNFLCTLKDSRSLIYFIEHGYINHLGTCTDSSHQLLPKERTFVAGYKRVMIFSFHIRPREAGENQWCIIHLILLCPQNILFHQFLVFRISSFIVTSHEPGHHNITFPDKFM